MKTRTVFAAAAFLLLATFSTARAHCDSMDGPVVQAARTALNTVNVNAALIWVKPADEQTIRDLFSRTLVVRKLGKDAQEMADMYFFETLVRLHRAGEGEPYTGLKPAGYYKGIYEAADRALRTDSIGELNMLTVLATHKLVDLHRQAHEAMSYSQGDLQAGREFVEKYTAYMHFVETLHGMVGDESKAHAAYE